MDFSFWLLQKRYCAYREQPFHRHRFFHHIPLTILTEHASVPADSRPYCLLAVARLAKHTPLAALRQKLETRWKLIFQAIRNFTISIVTACTFRCTALSLVQTFKFSGAHLVLQPAGRPRSE
eukprot:517777_1